MSTFQNVTIGITEGINTWEAKLLTAFDETIETRRNSQNRSIRQIVGHMVDSASNNTHRIVHLQYQQSPLEFPNYASNGNNDRWIAIQNYQTEDWYNLVQLWKYAHLHYIHVVNHINESKLQNQWKASDVKLISLEEMVIDFLRHFNLHLSEISELMD